MDITHPLHYSSTPQRKSTLQGEKFFVLTVLAGPITCGNQRCFLGQQSSHGCPWLLQLLCNNSSFQILNAFSCLLYKYLSVDGFPAVAGVGAVCRLDNRLPRGCPTEQLTPAHPRMAMCSGNDVSSTSASSLAWWQSSLHRLVLCTHLGRLLEGCCTQVHLSCSITVGAVCLHALLLKTKSSVLHASSLQRRVVHAKSHHIFLSPLQPWLVALECSLRA